LVIVLPKISTPEQSTATALRLRVLTYMNGAPSSADLRHAALADKQAK
jgi:hypothetical protein